MKKIICLLLTLILTALTAVPALSVSAAEIEEGIELIEGTYAPGQVVVVFKNSAIDNDTVPRKGNLAAVGADFGEMMDASSSEEDAYSAADDEIAVLKKSLGDDFVLEDTLVFDDGGQSFYSALSYDSADPIKGSAGFMDSEGDGVMWFVRHDYRESTDRELLEKLMSLSSMNGGFSGDKLEDKDLFIKVNEDYYNEMFRDVVMTVEVTFNNGAVSKKEIRFTAECSVDGYQTVNRLKSTSPDTFEEVTLYNYTITLKAKID